MSNSARQGAIAIGVQTVKGTPAASFTSYALTGHNINPLKDIQTLPPELGGPAFARGAYSTGYAVVGTIEGVARLDDIGYLLYGYAGKVTAVTASGVTTHTFTVNTDEFATPYMTIRRRVGSEGQVDQFVDCKIAMLELMIPPRGTLNFRITFIGISSTRITETIPAPSDDIFGVSCKGGIEIPVGDTSREFLGAVVRFVNQLTGPDEEQTIGRYTMLDVTNLGRAGQVNLTYLWQDRDLHDDTFYDGSGAFDPAPYKTDVKMTVESVEVVSGSTPYSLTLNIPTGGAAWLSEPLEARGNQILVMGLAGQLLATAGGSFEIELVNDHGVTTYDGSAIV